MIGIQRRCVLIFLDFRRENFIRVKNLPVCRNSGDLFKYIFGCPLLFGKPMDCTATIPFLDQVLGADGARLPRVSFFKFLEGFLVFLRKMADLRGAPLDQEDHLTAAIFIKRPSQQRVFELFHRGPAGGINHTPSPLHKSHSRHDYS